MNIFKKLASFALLTSLVCLSVLCNAAPSHAQTNEEAITYDAATKTATIQGDCDTDQVRAAMTGAAAQAETLHFAGTPTITTKQVNAGPFQGCSSLKYITADEDAHVSFAGNGSADPTLKYFFKSCSNLTSLDGLSVWDVSKVSGEQCMCEVFCNCTNLISLDGLSAWDVSNVSGDLCMENMFRRCSNLPSLDGLSTWNVSKVIGDACMQTMFCECSALTSLDSLSTWDVSEVSLDNCMNAMFAVCSNLTFLDGLSNWNIDKALSSRKGIDKLFDNSNSITSLAVGAFKLNSKMMIPTSFSDNINTWWPEKGTTTGIPTNELYDKSQDTATYGNRWVRSATNPYTNADDANIVWDVISKPYTGYNFRIGPTSVTLGGTNLKEGIDYYVLYTKEGSQKAYPVVREEGAYTANLYFQGKYPSSNSPFYTQTVYVGDAPDPTPSLTDGWHQSDAGWRYAQNGAYLNQGWAWVDNHWYFFHSDSYMAASEWFWDEGASSWYWVCSSGPMIRGLWQWIGNEWYGFWWNGKMCRGWVWDVDWQAWFYCYNNGIMARNAWEGPYWLNREGIWVR